MGRQIRYHFVVKVEIKLRLSFHGSLPGPINCYSSNLVMRNCKILKIWQRNRDLKNRTGTLSAPSILSRFSYFFLSSFSNSQYYHICLAVLHNKVCRHILQLLNSYRLDGTAIHMIPRTCTFQKLKFSFSMGISGHSCDET